MRPTPRTDKAEVYYSEIVTGREGGLYWVPADFARELESELVAAQNLAFEAHAEKNKMAKELASVERLYAKKDDRLNEVLDAVENDRKPYP